jgi:presenilin-like A22 family membrane protease
MFIITQLIGLAVIYSYIPVVQQQLINGTLQNVTINPIPYGMQSPETDSIPSLISIIIAFIIAILVVFLLTKFKASAIMRIWFFIVVTLVLGITFNAFFYRFIQYSEIFSIIIALPLAVFKIFKRNIIIHNLTELFIYPGIAVVFVPLLNVWTIIILLIIISIYDMWAVWHSGFMQKMAKYQINEMKIFAGFYVPYLNKKQRDMIKQAKLSKSKSSKKMKVNLAILGGGDVVFPIITAGVIFNALGLIPALIVILCATLSLLSLFAFAKKGKFYPAMPFLTAGLIMGIVLSYLFFHLL